MKILLTATVKALFLAAFFTACATSPSNDWVKISGTDCLVYTHGGGFTKITWTGDCEKGYASGEGVLEAWDEDVKVFGYGGFLEKGKMNGKGVLIFDSSHYYEGEFLDGEMHGQGKLTTELLVYEGEFMDGQLHGKGNLKLANGDEYTGDFKFGAEDGKGVLVLSNGTKYEGEFKEGLPHGYMVVGYADGDFFEGEYYMGEMHGSGKLTIVGEYTYEGVFEDGLPHGEGIIITERGNKGVGEFRFGELYNGELFDVATGKKLGVVVDGVVSRID